MQILGQPRLEKGATGQEGGEEGKNIQKNGERMEQKIRMFWNFSFGAGDEI